MLGLHSQKNWLNTYRILFKINPHTQTEKTKKNCTIYGIWSSAVPWPIFWERERVEICHPRRSQRNPKNHHPPHNHIKKKRKWSWPYIDVDLWIGHHRRSLRSRTTITISSPFSEVKVSFNKNQKSKIIQFMCVCVCVWERERES